MEKESKVDITKIRIRTLISEDDIDDARTALSRGHYLGDCKPQYRRLYQVAEYKKEWVAVLLWDQCVKRSKVRDDWIGWSNEARSLHCQHVVNNKRFCIAKPYLGTENLGSRILGLAIADLKEQWKKKYNQELLLCETYVDPSLFYGTCYAAAGWQNIGLSAGYAKQDSETGESYTTTRKKVFIKPLHDRCKEILSLPYPCVIGSLGDESGRLSGAIDFTKLDMEGLRSRLRQVDEPRDPHGIRHRLEPILSGIAIAIFLGCRGPEAISEWFGGITKEFLSALGLRSAPCESTIRRFLNRLNPNSLGNAIYGWLQTQAAGLTDQKVIAFDGKVLRGTRKTDVPSEMLLSAVLAPSGITIAQTAVSNKTNEIPVAQEIFETLPIAGKVLVADAIHTQAKTVELIKKKTRTSFSVSKAIKAIS